MSYPYGRPGDASGGQGGVGPGDPMFGGGPGGRPVSAPGSGGRKSSAGVIVACLVGLVVLALVGGVAFVALRSGRSEPGGLNPTATARPTAQQTITSDHYWADVLGGEFHIESTSVVQGPTDQDGAATLLVTLTMTNNTNKPEYAVHHVPNVVQKGVILGVATFDPDQNMRVLVYQDETVVEPGETVTVVAAYKYVYVGEPVTFVTALEPDDNRYDFPQIVVQPS